MKGTTEPKAISIVARRPSSVQPPGTPHQPVVRAGHKRRHQQNMQTHNAKVEFQQRGSASTLLKLPFTIPDSRLSRECYCWAQPKWSTQCRSLPDSDHPEQRVQPKFVSDDRAKPIAMAKVMPKLTPINAIALVGFVRA